MKKIKNEEIVQIAGIDFIKFSDQNGCTPLLAKDPLFSMTFGKNNDFRKSRILKRLQEDVLPKIVNAIGEENIVLHDVDLTALDGMQDYGTMQTRISIPTLDFYRQNNKLIRKYNPGSWWWLASNGYIVTEKEGRSSRKIYLAASVHDGQSIDNSVHPDTTVLSTPHDKIVYPIPFIKKENKKEKIDHHSVFVSWIQNVVGDKCSREKKNELYAHLIDYRDMRQEGNSPLNTSRKINGLLNDLRIESGGNVDVMCQMLRKATNNCWKSVHGPGGKTAPAKPQGGRVYEEL